MNPDPYKRTRWLIWLYFFLLIFEGAARKWFLKGLSNPLLIVRDPVVMLIYLSALIDGSLELKSRWLLAILALGLACLGASILAERFSPFVALFGMRTNFLHLPLIFVMGKALTLEDVRKLGRWVIAISIPMAFLMVEQFRAGPGHWLNAAAGGEGGQLDSAMGKVRASGTFSFVSGPVLFYPMATAYLLYSQLKSRTYPIWLTAIAVVTLVLASAASGSRSLLAACMICLLFFLFGLALHPPSMAKAFKVVLLGLFAYLSVGLFDVFHEASVVMARRIEIAQTGTYKGFEGYVQRISEMFSLPIFSTPLFGKGFGVGTNAGAAIMGVRGSFLLAESEWARVVLESGPLLGLAFIGLRIGIACSMLVKSVRNARAGNLMPFLMLGACVQNIINGQFGPPTNLGFAVFIGGCCFASLNQKTAEAAAPPKAQPRRGPSRRPSAHASQSFSSSSVSVHPRRTRPAVQPGRWAVRAPTSDQTNGPNA